MGLYLAIVVSICTVMMSEGYESTTKDWKCEKNQAPLCGELYNKTRFPNYFQQRSQSDAILELGNYKLLVSTGCAQHLRLFLCSLFVPMCTMLDENLLPCKSLCEDVKAGCEKVLLRYVGLEWPERLDCNQFPVYENGNICIEDTSRPTDNPTKVWVTENEKTRISENEKAILTCKGKKKINFRKIIHENKHCKRHISQEDIRKRCNGENSCEIKLQHVAKLKGQPEKCKAGHIGSSSIKYTCTEKKPSKQMVLKYGHDDTLYCKSSNRHIQILKVEFRDNSNNKCITPNAFCRITQSCTGKQNCALWAKRPFLSIPCKGQKLNLIVDYECEKTSSDEKVVEDYWENIALKCPSSSVLNIVRAEYIGHTCSMKNIHCSVNLYCTKKSKCQLRDYDYASGKCIKARSKIRIRYTCT